ncbi:Nickel transport complex, NikM subunit, transmembrane [Ferrimonas balearica DSM 9799]|uniref:Nickel transport complex, NikM subunit, transmembrane n=1 Tax=Ferrimonas balearica (strain DSM 9799 / CCM 4581 / KCTC 23876 / PAT) TaxID=550540 RepID=E1SS31_FERBD|nr:DUF4198 domain-containing protein [Ferrimonas balearica]ADN75986.1 Nickel transport complex, NikM subunit, transmembrane [Ferrimonas balearica DSM 9799]
MKKTLLGAGLVLGMVATAQAHPLWILPSHFTISKAEGEWVTVDATAAHATFAFDKPTSADPAHIIMPDGRSERPDALFKGKRRSVFDFFFVEEGTHKLVNSRTPFYMTTYLVGRRDSERRVPANKAERELIVPEEAREVKTIKFEPRGESYVTVMAPNRTALEATKKGFEMVPVTHPADIIENEEVTFQYLYNGEPVEGLKVDVTREGTLYRASQEAISVETNAKGEVTFTPAQAGRYIAAASHTQVLENDPMADAHRTMLNITFEVQLD